MKRIIILIAFMCVCGCATVQQINAVSLGMTKQQTIAVMGKPDSSSAKEGYEYLIYNLYETDTAAQLQRYTRYYVRFKDGKADEYGRMDNTLDLKVINR